MYGGEQWATQLGGWVVGTAIQALFLLTLRGVLKAVAPENRAMRPDLVWLNLIPYVQYVWMFVTLVKIRDSLRAESKTRGRPLEGDRAFRMGLASAIFFVLAFALSWVVLFVSEVAESMVALFSVLVLLTLVFWAIYWSRSSRLRAVLVREGSSMPGQVTVSAASPEPHCPTCGLLALPDDEHCRSCGLDLRAQANELAPPVETGIEAGQGTGEPASEEGAESPDAPATEGTCPFCGAAYRPNAKFCSTCGRTAV
jgi:hypothetical protein